MMEGDAEFQQTERSRKRRPAASIQRSSNACHRCKSKKIKCHYGNGSLQRKCVACFKSRSDCVFDVTPDGVPRGAAYVAALETRVAELEKKLRAVDPRCELLEDNLLKTPVESVGIAASEGRSSPGEGNSGPGREDENPPQTNILSSAQTNTMPLEHTHREADDFTQTKHKILVPTLDGITIFNFLQHPPPGYSRGTDKLPEIPSAQTSHSLIETVYLYTQARYCIVDWVRIQEWHQRRESLCYASTEDSLDIQIGAYFMWMMYAIGVQLIPNFDHSPEGYYARALIYLPAVLAQQNLDTVQALLTLVQYYYRAPGGPSIWHLVGATTRLCIELGLHRKASDAIAMEETDPYQIELQKRFFWCAYCLDRSVSILSKRPFSISDSDIDVELPVDVNVTCLNRDTIRDRQLMQAEGKNSITDSGNISTITAALHHLQMYRLRSKILSRFNGPHRPSPSHHDVMEFLSELDEWKEHAPPCNDTLSNVPRQSSERVQATYYHTALLLMRLILAQSTIDDDVLQRCAVLSADACENERVLCLSPQTHNSPITVYNCFRCGISFLQCLVRQSTVLPLRRVHRAISACSSALTVYTRTLAVAGPFLELFEKLSDHVMDQNSSALDLDVVNLQNFLGRVAACDPSRIPELLQSFPNEGALQDLETLVSDTDIHQYDFIFATNPISTLGMDPMVPYEMTLDHSTPGIVQEAMATFWDINPEC